MKSYTEAMRGLFSKDSVSIILVILGFVNTDMSDQFPASKSLVITTESTAKIFKKEVERKKRVISFPLLLSLRVCFLPLLAAAVSDYILSKVKYW